jgi:hypothetical protein
MHVKITSAFKSRKWKNIKMNVRKYVALAEGHSSMATFCEDSEEPCV